MRNVCSIISTTAYSLWNCPENSVRHRIIGPSSLGISKISPSRHCRTVSPCPAAHSAVAGESLVNEMPQVARCSSAKRRSRNNSPPWSPNRNPRLRSTQNSAEMGYPSAAIDKMILGEMIRSKFQTYDSCQLKSFYPKSFCLPPGNPVIPRGPFAGFLAKAHQPDGLQPRGYESVHPMRHAQGGRATAATANRKSEYAKERSRLPLAARSRRKRNRGNPSRNPP